MGTGNEVSGSTIGENVRNGVLIINTADVAVGDNAIVRNGLRRLHDGADQVALTGNLLSENGSIGIELVGDSAVVAGNTITRNGSDGVEDSGGDTLTITRNVIADNNGLGIDLVGGREDEFGVTRNSKGGINYPERLEATDDGTATVVESRIAAADPQSLTIELFANEAPDPSRHGEGETFVGSATPDSKGRFTATVPAGLAGQWLTATATYSTGDTSEFSKAVLVGVPKK